LSMRISNRLEPVKESAIRRFIELASKTKDVVHFEHGEPSFSTPGHIVEAATKAMQDGLTHYGPTPGLPELRRAISEKLAKENGLPVSGPEEVLVVCGTQEAMFLAALAFLEAGDEALVLDPYYPAYFEVTLIAGGKPVIVPLSADSGYRIEAEYLEKYVTSRTRMVWLNSPANPTGHVFSRKDMEEVAAVAERNDLVVFADEIYEKLVYDGVEHLSIGSLPGMGERVITANGFSKSYAMAGWRVGYVAADKKLIDAMSKLHYYAVLCPSTIAQKGALAALDGSQDCVRDMVREYDRRRLAVIEALRKIERVSFVRPKGAFYVFPNISRFSNNDETVAETLIQQFSVATVPGSGFGRGGSGYLRLSYSVPMSEIEEGLNRFQKGLQHFVS
jgi:aminotransferase